MATALTSETRFGVVHQIHSTTRATVEIVANDATVLQRRHTVNVIITYDEKEDRVTLIMSPTEASQPYVRSVCNGLLPEIATGFSCDNVALLGSVVNGASEVLLFAGSSPPPPITVQAVFRRSSSSTHHNTVKITISDTEIFTPLLEATIVSKTEMSIHASQRNSPGTIFTFLIRRPLGEDLSENLILSASDGNSFNVPRTLARMLLRMNNNDVNALTLSVANIPKPLLWLFRFASEKNLKFKSEMVRDLMMSPSVLILRILEWLPYLWIEEVGVWGCKILGNRINFDVGHGIHGVALSLGFDD